jgi:hypothetical protein
LSNDRLSRREDGTLALRLKTPWSDGTTHIVVTPAELVEKLIPLIPPPWFNRVRYHGVFAPNAKLRSEVVPLPEEEETCGHGGGEHPDTERTRPYYRWHDLMRRVFSVDVLACPKCRARMQQISVIVQPEVIKAILHSVGMAADSPEASLAA